MTLWEDICERIITLNPEDALPQEKRIIVIKPGGRWE